MTSLHKRIVGHDRAQRVAVGADNRARAATENSTLGGKPRAKVTNQQLAAAARERAAREPGGSLGRRAWGVAAVALSTTGTVRSARRVLDLAPSDIRDAARDLLGPLTERGTSPCRRLRDPLRRWPADDHGPPRRRQGRAQRPR